MKAPLSVALAIALSAGGCGSKSRSGSGPVLPDDSIAAGQLRAAVEPLYEDEILFGGMVIALIDPMREAGSVEYVSFGRVSAEHDEPPGEDAIFEIGSISKVFTALLLADAVARGEVALDMPVAQLLPFGVRFPDADGVRPTLVDLASHRSGMEALPANLAPTSLDDPYAEYGEEQLYAYLDRAQLMFVPGTAYAYSNLGAGVLGHVLARKIGQPYADAVRARVLEPLGLVETWIDVPAEAAARAVPGNTAGGVAAAPWTFDVLAGAGAFRSTPRDMVHLVEVATAAATGKDAPLAEILRTTLVARGDVGQDMEVAMAWHKTAAGVIWHNGMTGGQASFIGFDPATGRGVVALASIATPLVTRIGIGALDLLSGKPMDLDLKIVDLPDDELDRLAGRYVLGENEVLEVVRTGRSLHIAMGPERIRLYPRSATQFIVLELEASLDFVLEEGVVRGFVLHLPQGDVVAERIVDAPGGMP